METDPTSISRLIGAIDAGDEAAEKRLFTVVYDELRAMARARMRRESPGLTLQTTALVNEAYLKLVANEDRAWKGKTYFFGAAAEAMRRILVDRARKYRGVKHGGGRQRVPLDAELSGPERAPDLVALDEALTRLEALDPRKSEVVKLRYFVGLTVPETAALLEVSPSTVDKDWRMARAWLRREIGPGEDVEPQS